MIILLMDLKNCKSTSARTLSFWQGADQTLDYSLQFPFFADFKYLNEFKLYVQNQLGDEKLIQSKVNNDHYFTKQNLDKYNVQIGKLKAY